MFTSAGAIALVTHYWAQWLEIGTADTGSHTSILAYYNTTDHPRYNVAPQCIAACEHSVTVHTMAPN